MKFFFGLLFVGVATLVTYLFISYQQLNQSASPQQFQDIFVIKKGASFNSVLDRLSAKSLVKKNLFIKIYAKLTKYNTKMKAGEYSLSSQMTQKEILDELTTGKTLDIKVTFQEGLNIHDMAKILDSKKIFSYYNFLKTAKDKKFVKKVLGQSLPSFEGYLFPETYFVNKQTTAKDLIRKMVKNFKKNYEKSLEGSKIKLNKNTHIVLASMIEKETGAPQERTLISSVFHNRIRLKMRLQSDPTILYGIFDKTGVYPLNIRKKDILAKTRYNTYAVPGLPYGPIANPGLASMRAAVNPVKSEKLYFVSRNDGTHVFSESLAQHNAAVRKFQINPKAREGKSWRDRLKK